jgi:hypothetical protein
MIPDIPVANTCKEAAPWTLARRADDLPRDTWWTLYGDADLDALQKRLIKHRPDLARRQFGFTRIDGHGQLHAFPPPPARAGAKTNKGAACCRRQRTSCCFASLTLSLAGHTWRSSLQAP